MNSHPKPLLGTLAAGLPGVRASLLVVVLSACATRLDPTVSDAQAASRPIALVGATLVNPNQPPVPDAVVVVRDGRVVCAGARGACSSPANARVVDVRGAYVGPGLIDAHVHYSWTGWVDARPDVVDLRARFRHDSVLDALQRAPERLERALLCAGVTSVFDAGGYPWTVALRESRERPTPAPRMAGAGAIILSRESRLNQFLNLPSRAMFVVPAGESARFRSWRPRRRRRGRRACRSPCTCSTWQARSTHCARVRGCSCTSWGRRRWTTSRSRF